MLNTGKELEPCVAVLVHCAFDLRILHVSPLFPGSTTDMTSIKYDAYAIAMKEQGLFTQYEYQLVDKHGVASTHRGVYELVDNGFIESPQLIPPYSSRNPNKDAILFSRRVESLRKSAERVIGVLKKRFCCLKNNNMQGRVQIQNCWYAAAALHNMILRENSESVVWNYELGLTPEELALRGLRDQPGGAEGALAEADYRLVVDEQSAEVSAMEARRMALVEHYAYKHARKEVVWPQRLQL